MLMSNDFFAQSFADGISIREMDCGIESAYGQDTHTHVYTQTITTLQA